MHHNIVVSINGEVFDEWSQSLTQSMCWEITDVCAFSQPLYSN